MSQSATPPTPQTYAAPLQVAIAFTAFIMVLYGNTEVLPGTGPAVTFKCIFIALSVGLLVGGFNANATRFGAPRAAAGSALAIAVCVGGYIVTSALVGTMSFAGMTITMAERSELEAHGRYLAAVSARMTRSTGNDVIAQLKTIKDGFGTEASGEQVGGTATRRPSKAGAPQPVTDYFRHMESRVAAVIVQLTSAEREAVQSAQRVKSLLADYGKVVGDETLSRTERRAKLQKLDTGIREQLTASASISPRALATSLVSELRNSVVADAGSAQLQRGLEVAKAAAAGHAERLEKLLDEAGEPAPVLPSFPAPAQVTAGFRNLVETWPYALLAYGLELIGGGFLWLFAVLHERGRRPADGAVAERGRGLQDLVPASPVAGGELISDPPAETPLGPHPHRIAAKGRKILAPLGNNGSSVKRSPGRPNEGDEEGV